MAFEDYTTFVEVDPIDDVTILSSTTIEFTQAYRHHQCYVYKDYGAGNFGNLEHLLEFNITDAQAGNKSSILLWAISNHIMWIRTGTNWDLELTAGRDASGNLRLLIYDIDTANADTYYGPSENAWYYLKIDRTGTTFTVYIYSDSARTVLVDTMTITCSNTTARYLYAAGTVQSSNTSYPYVSGYVARLNIQDNQPPNAPNNPDPGDGETGVSPGNVTIEVDVSDPDGDTMDVYFYDASDDSLIGTDSGVADGGTASVIWASLECGTSYEWYAIADDGALTTSSATFTFETTNCPLDWPLKAKVDNRYKYDKDKGKKYKYREIKGKKYKYEIEKQE